MKKLWLLPLVLASLSVPRLGFALDDHASVPVLTYHSWDIHSCAPESNAPLALKRDLETLYQNGFTVVPVYWIAEWARGSRAGSTLPAKVVGITFDDGFDRDWKDGVLTSFEKSTPTPCTTAESFRTVLTEFKSRHQDLPWYSPHASSFVIASPIARRQILGTSGNDDWWRAAQESGIMEIYNHSADHDHDSIKSKVYDSNLGIYVAVGGNVDGVWAGQGNFFRIGMDIDGTTSTNEVVKSAQYIKSIIGVWPDLFAYPYGNHSDGLIKYFQTKEIQHQTFAAFCGSGGYVSRNSPPYCLERFVNQWNWSTTAELIGMLQNSHQLPTAAFYINGQANGNITLVSGMPFTLNYVSSGTSSCDLTGYVNGSVWYTVPSFSTSYDWGVVTGLDGGSYRWSVTCRDTLNNTTTATASLYVSPALSATFYINGQPNDNITVVSETSFAAGYASSDAISCGLQGYANGEVASVNASLAMQ